MSLLELLDAPGIHSTAQLAADLNTTPEMVEAKLERYAQLGYVKKTVMPPTTFFIKPQHLCCLI